MRFLTSLTVVAALCWECGAQADTLELVNGDLVSGSVVSLNDKELVLQSDLLGEIKIPRDKVATISLGNRKPNVAARAAANPAPAMAPGSAPRKPQPAANWSFDDIIKQLQAGGADLGKMIEDEFPLVQTPEVQDYIQKTLGGLIKGDLSLEDLRKQAIDVRNQVRELEQELGPEAVEALKPYTGILDKFIREAEPRKK